MLTISSALKQTAAEVDRPKHPTFRPPFALVPTLAPPRCLAIKSKRTGPTEENRAATVKSFLVVASRSNQNCLGPPSSVKNTSRNRSTDSLNLVSPTPPPCRIDQTTTNTDTPGPSPTPSSPTDPPRRTDQNRDDQFFFWAANTRHNEPSPPPSSPTCLPQLPPASTSTNRSKSGRVAFFPASTTCYPPRRGLTAR
ncbi:hypothetical protein PGTUg99_030435 [Puccinia graminis f. sp. tritici]|uniref:Uncharacterized protein n=1 Tax=Puccinia graminis f. sp. tritici TaxID=56615 RepID=A0A5B0RKI6_PUCGR|nr:hypothetical protein PGTUg99_030435 [Puccinia graminis f. sp. tritici]